MVLSPNLLAHSIFLLQRSQTCSTIRYEKKIRKGSFWEVASNTDKRLLLIQTSERVLCTTSNIGGGGAGDGTSQSAARNPKEAMGKEKDGEDTSP